MSITFNITKDEIEELKRFTEAPIQSLKKQIVSYLNEVRVIDAEVSLIRRKGKLCRGSGRIPFEVRADNQSFVIKSYDIYGAQREKEVLKVVEGKFAPKVLFFGKKFYAEELVDHNSAISLESIADSGNIDRAIELGAKTHSGLAKLSVNYSHDHWLDEFHLVGEKILVTDFGCSYLFLKEKQFDKDILSVLKTRGISECFDYANPVPCFDRQRPMYSETKEAILMLGNGDLIKKLNLWCVLGQAARGIKTYFESRRYGINSWDKAMEAFPVFVDYFSKAINENKGWP